MLTAALIVMAALVALLAAACWRLLKMQGAYNVASARIKYLEREVDRLNKRRKWELPEPSA